MTRCNPFPFFAAALAGTVLHAQCTNPWLPGTGYPGVLGRTADATAWDPDGPGPATDRLVLVGDFTLAGSTAAYQLAVFDPATGAWSELGGNPDGDIRAVLALPNGDLIAAGDFRHIGGVLVDYIARWDGTSWLAIGGGMSSSVYSLALAPNGDVVAGGTFSQAGGITALRVARWNGLMWSAIGTGIGPGSGSRVASLAIAPNGDIAAGGYLRTGSGSVGSPFRYWDGVSWGSLGFGAAANEVRAVAIRPNGNIAVGGLFNLVGGTPVNYVAEWNGSSWVPLGAGNDNGTDNWVNELAVAPNGDLLVGGNFTRAGSIVAAKVARWDGTSWSSFGGGVTTHPTEYVLTLTSMPNGDLFVSGSFETAGGVPARSVARWDGAAWSALLPGTDGAIATILELDNGDVLFGGSFSTIDGSPVRRLARLQGSTWSQLGGGVEGYVSELVPAPNGDVYAVGSISAAGGIAVNNVARWDGTGWSPVGGGTDRAVSAAAVLPNGDLVVVGYFTMAGGVPVSRVARWDGIAWHPLGTGIGSSAFASVQDAAVLPNGDLVVTGDFGLAGGVAAHNIARWDGASWWPFGAGLDRGGTGLGVRPNGDLLVGGYFATADTVAAQCVAVWNGTTFSPLGAGVGSGGGNHVRTFVTLPNGDLLVGGDFFAAGGVTANNIARWNGTGWTAFGTGADGDVQALALLRSGTLAVGGTFLSVDGDVSTFHGWLGTTCPPSTSVVPTGCVGPVGPVVLAAATAPFVGGRFDTTATGLANGALALAIVGLGQQSIPLAQLHPAGLPGCDLLSSTEAVRLLLPSAGTVTNSLAIPNDLGLVGVQLVHQFVQAELDPQGGVVSLSSSNALRFQVGAF